MSKFKQTLIMKRAKPYPTITNPSEGVDQLFSIGFAPVRIEYRADGAGILDEEEVEFVDLRVYLKKE